MSIPEQPLSPDVLDELVSADIDGELDRAAVDLGLDPQAARAGIEADPGGAARRDALLRARAALSTPPPLDAARDAQLVAAALAATETRPITRLHPKRSARVWQAVAGIAAAVVVVAGVAALAGRSTGSSKSSRAASGVENGTATRPPHTRSRTVTFGDVSNPDALQRAVRDQLLENAPVPAATGAAAGGKRSAAAFASETTESTIVPGPATYNGAQRATIGAPHRCVASIRHQAHLTSAPVLSGTGTSEGRPVVVVVFARAHAHVVYVLSAADCSVVSRVTTP